MSEKWNKVELGPADVGFTRLAPERMASPCCNSSAVPYLREIFLLYYLERSNHYITARQYPTRLQRAISSSNYHITIASSSKNSPGLKRAGISEPLSRSTTQTRASLPQVLGGWLPLKLAGLNPLRQPQTRP